jgi:hypothetical protein
MNRYKLQLFTFLLCVAAFSLHAQTSFRSALIGKNIADTPLSDYIKEDVKGDQFILLIAYGCHHCQKAVQQALRLRTTNSIDNFIVLGSEAEETSAKSEFMTKFADEDLKIIDYDWTTFPGKFTIPEPGFPNPPVVFYIQNNIIISILTEVPDKGNYRRSNGK